MTDFIQATLNAGLQIALSLNARTPNLYTKHARGAGGDISIGADLLSEEIFITQLSKFGNIDSEESGFIDNKKAHTIVIDPLDGSDNFISQIPYYGASVAMKNTNSASCGDFLGSASARFVNEPKSSISSLASHNPKNSSTILEFASCKNAESRAKNAESTQDSAVDCHDSALYAESRNDEFLDSAKIGIIMNFCNLSAVVSFKGKNYYGNLAQEFSQFTKSSTNSASCGDFLGSASARFVNEPTSSISSLASHNPKNSSTILEFASYKNAESNAKFAESRNDAFLDSANFAKCGIFEGAYRNPHICALLNENNIKFRSLGALALSLGLSERVNFVLFNGKKRHYDTEAGFLIAQNLHRIERENLVLISKDKILFDKISNLLF